MPFNLIQRQISWAGNQLMGSNSPENIARNTARNTEARKRKSMREAISRELNDPDLLREIGDTSTEEIGSLLREATSSNQLREVQESLKQARAGELPKWRSRMQTHQMFTTMTQQPGLRQVRTSMFGGRGSTGSVL